MNRKNINELVGKFIPLDSQIIGAPRRKTTVNNYCISHPGNNVIHHCDQENSREETESLPDFFKEYDFDYYQQYYVACLKNARVWGNNGAVVAAGDYFLTDISREFNKGLNIEHSIYYTIKQVKSRHLKGVSAVIGTAGANIYYHWMVDILPRLGLIAKMTSLDSIDYFITEFSELPFQKETLDKIGIPCQKIIASNDNWNFHIKSDTLFVPSLAGLLDQPNDFQVNFLRSLFKDCISNEAPFKKLYISRKKTGRREIVNEEELIAYLSKHNFEIIYCEEMTVAEQAKMFSEAKMIVCSHGSALTNLVFCKPGTCVLDIFNQSHINACFWFISHILSLDYHYVVGISRTMDNNPKNDNTIVDITEFKNELTKMGLTG
jgi:capsular polysaccharide biosynthesis protein